MVVTKKAIDSEAYIKKIGLLLESLKLEYKDISQYILAFIHKSIVNERPDFAPTHNERLEFLGDAVLELVITDKLYKDFPNKPEGVLTDIRSALVRGRNLAEIAKKIHISEALIMGKGEELSGGRENEYILANTIEALIGAIYLDLGIKTVESFIETHIYITLQDILDKNLTKDYKTIFQEYTQAKYDITPHYEVISEEGPDHNKIFEVGVYLNKEQKSKGKGSSKKKAEEKAAENAYQLLNQKI